MCVCVYVCVCTYIKLYTHTQEKQTLLLFTADGLHKTLIQKVKKYF